MLFKKLKEFKGERSRFMNNDVNFMWSVKIMRENYFFFSEIREMEDLANITKYLGKLYLSAVT